MASQQVTNRKGGARLGWFVLAIQQLSKTKTTITSTLKLCKKKVGPLALSQQNKGPCAAPDGKRGKPAAVSAAAAAESLSLKLINFGNERVTLYPCWW